MACAIGDEIRVTKETQQSINSDAHRTSGSVCILLLAAGRSSRMKSGTSHKLLALFDGVPLIRRMAERATRSAASRVYVVTGYNAKAVEHCLSGLEVKIVHNPDFAFGMATSLGAGLRAAGDEVDSGFLVLLGDMPDVTTDNINTLIEAFKGRDGKAITRALSSGKPGNPAILPMSLYHDLLGLSGDRGARQIIETCGLEIVDVEIGAAAVTDVDTEEDLISAGGIPAG
jgi:molybdenum cofactor cytidylyltransferase